MKMLKTFVKAIEIGAYPGQGIDIWAAIPGGIIFGKIVSLEQFGKHLKDQLPPESPGDERSIERQAQEALDKVARFEQHTEETEESLAPLVDVIIVSGNRTLKMPVAELRIDSVAAWGIGTLSQQTNET